MSTGKMFLLVVLSCDNIVKQLTRQAANEQLQLATLKKDW